MAQYWLTRFCFQRSLALLYLLGFLIAAFQFRALAGDQGLAPARLLLKDATFWEAPSLFWLGTADKWLALAAWSGVALSVLALTGLSDAFGFAPSIAVWSLLWILYLSFVNVGGTFYGFGWEMLLLETGFLAIFLGPTRSAPPELVLWCLRWVLFRLMFGAGLIKLRGDPCWRDLTCMLYHYETQPIPNPLSWYFHHLPAVLHKLEVLFTHFVEIAVPFLYFAPRPWCQIAGALTILFQGTLILSGNLSWLNYLSIVLCIPLFDDAVLSRFLPMVAHPDVTIAGAHRIAVYVLTAVVGLLSIRPALNLVRSEQLMNASFDSLHLVNTYGAFGSVGRERFEVILEGTTDTVATPATKWREYAFKAKPGDPAKRPPIVSPYHYRLDWQIWFAAMSSIQYHPWLLNLVAKLLRNDAAALSLMGENPFPDSPPKLIRARLYLYRFTKPGDPTGAWWDRALVRGYLPPLSLDDPEFRAIRVRMGWEEE